MRQGVNENKETYAELPEIRAAAEAFVAALGTGNLKCLARDLRRRPGWSEALTALDAAVSRSERERQRRARTRYAIVVVEYDQQQGPESGEWVDVRTGLRDRPSAARIS